MGLSLKVRRSLLQTLALPLILILLVSTATFIVHQTSRRSASRTEAITPAASTAHANYGRIPLNFESNHGQTDASVNFLARGAGYTLFLKPAEAVFTLQNSDCELRNEDGSLATSKAAKVKANPQSATCITKSKVLRMKLAGADQAAAVQSSDELSGKVNYFTGNDPERWQTEIPTYARVSYTQVYPGVDIVYYGNQRQLEYDFIVAPGRDARSIKLQFDGADKVEVDAAGDLLLSLGKSVIRQPKPLVYQEVAGTRRAVDGGYVIDAERQVGFTVGVYDAQLPLIIDPVLVYSTYLGGAGGEQALEIAIDPSGNAYVTGFTNSTNFPTANALQATNGGFQDAFVTKINAAGTAFVYSTYLGGSSGEQARGIAVDSAGNAYITGFTGSTNFPTANAIQSTLDVGGQDAFVTKLNAAGSALVYSTFLGGVGASNSAEFGEDIAVDSAGNAYVTGSTFSNNFPVVNAVQATFGGFTDAYVTKINAAGSALVFSTYLGGSDSEIGEGINVDSAGNVYITGDTQSTNFPTANAVQAANGGGQDAFVTKLNAAGSAFVYSTYLGGSAQDDGEAIAPDSSGNTYLTGNTFSTNFPTANAIQPVHGGGVIQDAFVTKLNAAGNAFVYSTYLGGTGGEIGFGIAVDAAGNAYIAGGTGSLTSFPTANAIQCASGGSQDVFVTKLNSTGSAFIFSTYLGGSGVENGRGIAIDSSGGIYVGGFTRSSDFPTVNPIQSTFGGDATFGDAFVTKISDTSTLPASSLQFSQATYNVDEDLTFVNVTVQRNGDTSGAVTVDYATNDGSASERMDYTTALGTLHFAAGETSKIVALLVNEDSRVEGPESFTLTLSNPTGGASLACTTPTATIQIADDAVEPTTNAIDDSTIFVGQHYHDFLNRQSDPAGLAFWVNQIESCGADAQCREVKRINVSAAFFLSIEFQQTGYFVIRTYKSAFGSTSGNPTYRPFLRDTQEVGRGVVIGTPGADAMLEANKQAFALAFVQRADFQAAHGSQNADAYVDSLFANAGATPSAAERAAAITAFGTGDTAGRAAALRNIVDSGAVFNKLYNPAFVLMQYFGYLRRNPNDSPDGNFSGYDFWLMKMDQFSLPGEDVRDAQVALSRVQRAEMVKAFIVSGEYRGRFAP